MLEWFIIVVLYTSNPAIEGQPLFVFEKPFESKEECITELQQNSMTYFVRASMAYGGRPPRMANCVDTKIVEEIKAMEKGKAEEFAT